MSELWDSSAFYGESAAWLESMYETYITDPDKLEDKWRLYFDSMPDADLAPGISQLKSKGNGGNGAAINRKQFSQKVRKPEREISPREVHDYVINYAQHEHARGYQAQVSFDHEKKQVQVLQLINAYRFLGHKVANLNPLGGRREPEVAELDLQYHELSSSDLDTVFETGSLAAAECLPLREIHQRLQQSYCGTVGSEYMHIMETKEKRWKIKDKQDSRTKIRIRFICNE